MAIRGSGIRTGDTLQDMAVDALCESRKGMDKVSIAVDQMRQAQKRGSKCVEKGNTLLEQIAGEMTEMVRVMRSIDARLAQQEELVERQERAAGDLKEEMRATRGSRGGQAPGA